MVREIARKIDRVRQDPQFNTHRRVCVAAHTFLYPSYIGAETLHWFTEGALFYSTMSGTLFATMIIAIVLGVHRAE